MKIKNKGFTLIELIIVIVILGIFAAIATPRFLSISKEARISTLERVETAMIGASNLVKAKAINFTSASATCTVIELCGVGRQRNAPSFPETRNGSAGIILVWPRGKRLADLCYTYYYNREDGSEPTTGIVQSGC